MGQSFTPGSFREERCLCGAPASVTCYTPQLGRFGICVECLDLYMEKLLSDAAEAYSKGQVIKVPTT